MSSNRNVPIWRRGWPPSPLTIWFMAIVVFDAIMLILAMGIVTTGNDPAGNGMVDGFRQGFAQLCTCALALLTLIFLVIRHRGIRIALMVMLVPLTVFSLLLTRRGRLGPAMHEVGR